MSEVTENSILRTLLLFRMFLSFLRIQNHQASSSLITMRNRGKNPPNSIKFASEASEICFFHSYLFILKNYLPGLFFSSGHMKPFSGLEMSSSGGTGKKEKKREEHRRRLSESSEPGSSEPGQC